jgi:hypothetical protein
VRRYLPLDIALLAALALTQPVPASAQPREGEPGVPQIPDRPQLPDRLNPRERIPLPLPREAELTLQCWWVERTVFETHKSRFATIFAPTPVLPGFALRDQVMATTGAIVASVAATAPPAIATPSMKGLEKEALRAALLPSVSKAAVALAHFEHLRSQIRLIRAGRADATTLSRIRVAQRAAYALPGPTPDEFATLATVHGDPEPCKDPQVARERAPRKAALEKRFEAYRYGDELYRVLQTLDESGAVRIAMPMADPGTCVFKPRPCTDIRPEIALLPYWLSGGLRARIVESEEHPIDAFHDAVTSAGTALGGAADRFRASFLSDGAALLPQAKALQQQLQTERGQLAVWQQQLDVEAAALAAQRVEIAKQQARVVAIHAALPVKDRAIAALKQESIAAKAQKGALTASISAKRGDIVQLRAAIASLALNCGGATYPKCNDAAAKLDYDRQRYELYQKLDSATAELFDLQTQRQAQMLRAAELQEQAAKAQSERQDLIAERAEGQVYLTKTIPELNVRQATWETDRARAMALSEANVADLGVINALVLIASSEP